MSFFQKLKKVLIFSCIMTAFPMLGMQSTWDYITQYKKEIAAGVGAAALTGAAYYYGKQSASPQTSRGISYASSSLKFESTEEKQLEIADGSTVRIANSVGNIDSESYAGNELKVVAKKRAETEKDLNRLKVEIIAQAKNILIKTTYENPREMIRGLIDYKIFVPRNKSISQELLTSVGNVIAENANANLLTQSSTGHITIVQDMINANHTATTSVGNINIIANAIDAYVNAHTAVGSITSDFKLSSPVKKQVVGQSLNAQIGKASSAQMNLSTSTGNIVLKRKGLARL